MKINTKQSNFRTIRPGDSDFMLTDGLMITPRAGFEISQSCPAEYKSIFITAINAGWLKPIANVYARDLTFQALKESK
jgi:hypothetical protein